MASRPSFARMKKSPAFTGAGDAGETGLIGGRRVRKSSARVRAYGDVDELNSLLGVTMEFVKSTRVKKIIHQVQLDLFALGTELASPGQRLEPIGTVLPSATSSMLAKIEDETSRLHEELPALRNFVLPGGSAGAAFLHLSRASSRRAEREVVALSETEAVRPVVLQYLNRLSSLLFELARFENHESGRKEEIWSGKSYR